ncbi:MAG: Ig-like domain-containing protein [Desulfuromonadaceae bacterium]|nr:Ig-like domain-containing protein [Desulfuromonadaceae bacterium]
MTNDTTPTISGTAEGNSSVNIYDGANLVTTVISDAGGNWGYTFTPLTLGSSHSFTVTVTDVAGNISSPSAAYDIQVEAYISPPVITGADDNVDPLQGNVSNNGFTNDTTPRLVGTADAGSTVNIYDAGTLVGTVTAAGDGSWGYTTSFLSDGTTHAYTATATNSSGTVSEASAPYVLNIDVTATTPAITGISDSVIPVVGNVPNGGYTNETTPIISGIAEANSRIDLYDGALLITTLTADKSGSWRYTSLALANGSDHSYTIIATDTAGNISQPSAVYVIHVDTVAPAVPVINGVHDHVDPVQTDTVNNGYTNDTTPTLFGTAEANSVVTIKDGAALLAAVNADATGNWSYTTDPLADGSIHSYTVTATDAAGNSSFESTAFVLNVDNTAPLKPIITSINDNVALVTGNVVNGGTTNDSTPTLSGIAEANSMVTLYDGAVTLASVTADATGKWSYTTAALADNSDHNYSVTATDAAGNVSIASDLYSIHIDTTPPLTPLIGGLMDDTAPITGTVTNGYSNDITPTLYGTAEANITIGILDNGLSVASVTSDSSGNWSYTSSALINGSNHSYSVTATDAAGNTSPVSAPYSVIIDTTISTPVIIGANDNVNPLQGNIVNGGNTNDTTPTLSGTAEANSSVSIFNAGILLGTVTVGSGGIWSYTTVPLNTGETHNLTAISTDLAGNVSSASAPYTIVVDTYVPPPVINWAVDNFGAIQDNVANGGYTDDRTPSILGTADPGSTVKLYNGTTLFATVSAGIDGSWSYTPTFSLADPSNLSFTATATNSTGVISDPSLPFILHIDSSAMVPVISYINDDAPPFRGNVYNNGYTDDTTPKIQGIADVNSTVTIYDDGVFLQTVTADASGSWDYTTLPLLDGSTHTFTVTAVDVAGNSSTSLPFVLHIDKTAPPAPVISGALDNVELITGTVTNGTTNDTTPTLFGTAEANSKLTIYDNDREVGSVVADSSGNWSYTFDPLTNGSNHNFRAMTSDAASNTSPVSSIYNLYIDTVAPSIPVITQVTDNVSPLTGNVTSGSYTNETILFISGTAEAKSSVNLYDGATNLIATVTANTSGVWSYTTSALIDGSSHAYSLTASDSAGNVSAYSAPYIVNIDTTAQLPVITGVDDNVLSLLGNIENGGYTNDPTPTFSGTAEANSSVNLYDYGSLVDTVSANATGNWSYTPDFVLGSTHSYTASIVDLAGNVSATTTPYVLHIFDAVPTPVITKITDNYLPVIGDVPDNGYTNDITPVIDGTSFSNAIITLYDNGIEVTTSAAITADSSGNWSYAFESLDNGTTHTYSVTATNATGNISNVSSPYTINIDTTSPLKPLISLATDANYNVTGAFLATGLEPSANLEYSTDGNNWSAVAPSMISGHNTVYLHQLDQAGNISPYSLLDFYYGSGNVSGITAGSLIVGGVGDDTLQGNGAVGTHDTLYGSAGNDTITGGNGDNTFYGGTGTNIITGGDGTNHFVAGAGNDTIHGVGINNILDYTISSSAVTASFSDAAGIISHGGMTDTYDSIQSLIGSDYSDTFTIDVSKSLPALLDGGASDASGSGNLLVLQNLVTGSYNMNTLAAVSTNIDNINIMDGKDTTLVISSQDIQNMVNNGSASQLYVDADNGDALNISLSPGQSVMQTYVDASHTDYTIYSGTDQLAQVHWHHT